MPAAAYHETEVLLKSESIESESIHKQESDGERNTKNCNILEYLTPLIRPSVGLCDYLSTWVKSFSRNIFHTESPSGQVTSYNPRPGRFSLRTFEHQHRNIPITRV